jgi:hypothetical protein
MSRYTVLAYSPRGDEYEVDINAPKGFSTSGNELSFFDENGKRIAVFTRWSAVYDPEVVITDADPK